MNIRNCRRELRFPIITELNRDSEIAPTVVCPIIFILHHSIVEQHRELAHVFIDPLQPSTTHEVMPHATSTAI